MKTLLLVLALLAVPALASAQLTVTYTFVNGTTIDAGQVNTNFATFANALNRTGGTMTGSLTSRQIVPAATATYDLGTTTQRYRDLWLSNNATVGGNLVVTGTLTAGGGGLVATSLSCTGCIGPTELGTVASITPGVYGSATAIPRYNVDADGRIIGADVVTPQLTLTSVYFSSLNASALTNLTAANLVGTIPAGALPPGSVLTTGSNTFTGINAYSAATSVALTCDGASVNQDVNPGPVTAFRLTTGGGGKCFLGGLSGGSDGRFLFLMNATNQTVAIVFDSAGSTLANRFAPGGFALEMIPNAFALFIYDATAQRWRPLRGLV